MYALHYHFVFITKYRKPVLRGEIGTEVRDLIREICRSQDIEILQGHIRPDHVHLLLSVPPSLAPSRVMQAIKGKTSHHLLMDHRRLRKEYLGSAPVGTRLLRVQQRPSHGRGDSAIHQAARCRAPGRRPLSSQRGVSLHGAAKAGLQSTSVDPESLAYQETSTPPDVGRLKNRVLQYVWQDAERASRDPVDPDSRVPSRDRQRRPAR